MVRFITAKNQPVREKQAVFSGYCILSQFVHLHLHTQYSLLNGVNKINQVIERAQALGQPAIAMTDHGNLHGAVEFYSYAQKIGIKPVIGCELYVTPASRLERKPRSQGGAGTYHLTALSANLTGYRNLCRLVTLAYREGFYFKPRIDHELLKEYSEGLILLSGCVASEMGDFACSDNVEACRRLVDFYALNFPDRFYLEVQPHHMHEQEKLNQACVELARAKGLPLVATTDCHYLNAEDHHAQEVLMCISTGSHITDPDRLRYDGLKLHLKSADEMREEFGDSSYAEEAISNSVRIAAQCNLEFDFSRHYMPRFEVKSGQSLDEAMAEAARQGLTRRLETLAHVIRTGDPVMCRSTRIGWRLKSQ